MSIKIKISQAGNIEKEKGNIWKSCGIELANTPWHMQGAKALIIMWLLYEGLKKKESNGETYH